MAWLAWPAAAQNWRRRAWQCGPARQVAAARHDTTRARHSTARRRDSRLKIEVVGGGPGRAVVRVPPQAAVVRRGRSGSTSRTPPPPPTASGWCCRMRAGRRVRSAAPAAFDRIARRMERWPDHHHLAPGRGGHGRRQRLSRPSTGSSCFRTPARPLPGSRRVASLRRPGRVARGGSRGRRPRGRRRRDQLAGTDPRSKPSSGPAPNLLGNRYAWYGTRQVFDNP